MFGKTIMPWQKRRYLQNGPHVQWLQLMRPSHDIMGWICRDAALLFHCHRAQSVCPSQIQPHKINQPRVGVQENWHSGKAVLYSTVNRQ